MRTSVASNDDWIIQRLSCEGSANSLEDEEYRHFTGSFSIPCSVATGAPLMLKPGYMFRSDEKGQHTTEAVMSEMISVVTHNT